MMVVMVVVGMLALKVNVDHNGGDGTECDRGSSGGGGGEGNTGASGGTDGGKGRSRL